MHANFWSFGNLCQISLILQNKMPEAWSFTCWGRRFVHVAREETIAKREELQDLNLHGRSRSKKFKCARQSETGKEHLKTCKAASKATKLERNFTCFSFFHYSELRVRYRVLRWRWIATITSKQNPELQVEKEVDDDLSGEWVCHWSKQLKSLSFVLDKHKLELEH